MSFHGPDVGMVWATGGCCSAFPVILLGIRGVESHSKLIGGDTVCCS
jgi:hypothetical protein